MATITSRKRKDGSTAYRAQIIIKRKGVVHREGETFNNERDAKLWIKARDKAFTKLVINTKPKLHTWESGYIWAFLIRKD